MKFMVYKRIALHAVLCAWLYVSCNGMTPGVDVEKLQEPVQQTITPQKEVSNVTEAPAPSGVLGLDADPSENVIEKEIQYADQAPDDEVSYDIMPQGTSLQDEFNEPQKRKNCEALVNKAIAYIKSHSLIDSCNKLTHTKDFMQGELYVFLVDYTGTIYAHGQDVDMLWSNLYNLKDRFGSFFIQEVIKKAQKGGGWMNYEWKNATKTCFIKPVVKDGKSFAVATGYYSHSKADAVRNLVTGAANFFNQIMKEGLQPEDAFSNLSYPLGKFVFGDLYLYALDFQGNHVAHGDRPGLIGTNGIDYQDSNGLFVNKEIIKRLSTADETWIKYTSRKAIKETYARKVTDKEGKNYFIACGYYPEVSRTSVIDLVKRGYQYMKINGKGRAADIFSDKKSNEFRYGDLYVVVFDSKGRVVADGNNPDLIGQNLYNVKDDDGRYYVREIIKKASEGNTWINIKSKNAYMAAYYEKIDLGVDQFFIGSGLYPVSKNETMILSVKSAASFLKITEPQIAFNEFVMKDSKFTRGDLSIFAFDTSGICYAYGDDHNLIWRNLISVTDDEGKPFIRNMIETAVQGSAIFKNFINKATKLSYVEPVEKNGKIYLVGSSFYL